MKYKTIIETDDFENFEFFEDGNGKYMCGKDAVAVNHDNEWIALYFTECKQEDVLDKIRAEIEELDVLKYSSGERIYKDEVLDIIDKYKAEMEGEE